MATAAARTLRVISFAEGLSYIGLMGIAMPLKYVANMPTMLATNSSYARTDRFRLSSTML